MSATRQKDLCGIEGKRRVAASPRLEFPHHRLRPLPHHGHRLVTRWKKAPVSMTSKWMLVKKGASQKGRHGARIHSCCHADASYRLYYPVVPLLIQPVHQIKHQRGVAWISMSGIKKKVPKKITSWAGSHQQNQFGILRRRGGWVTIWDLAGSLNRLGPPPPHRIMPGPAPRASAQTECTCTWLNLTRQNGLTLEIGARKEALNCILHTPAKTHGWDLLTCRTRLTRTIWARRGTHPYPWRTHTHTLMPLPQVMA